MINLKTKGTYFFFFLTLFFIQSLLAQFKSTADGFLQQQYSSRAYGLHPRNFDVCQSEKGFVFVGNAYGVIQFDGKKWNTIPLPSGNSALTVSVFKGDTLAAGGYNELGLLVPNSKGNYSYRSLLPLLPEQERNMGGVYSCFPWENGIVFFSFSGIFIYKNSSFQIIKPSKGAIFQYACKVGSSLWMNDSNMGLMEWVNGKSRPYFQDSFLKGKEIVSIIKSPNGVYILSKSDLFKLNQNGYEIVLTNSKYPFFNSVFSNLLNLSNGRMVLSTLNQGVFVLDETGFVKHHLHQGNGLQGNCIHRSYQDGAGNLWLAMDNGMACLDINSPFRFAGLQSGIHGMGYSAAQFQNTLYLATSQGVYWMDKQQRIFHPVENISGQIWNLKVLGNSLLCCHSDGVYEIKGTKAFRIEPERSGVGHWMFLPLSNNPTLALKGTYEGIELYKYKSGKWTYVKRLSGFSESSRIMVEDEEGLIWICHGNKGVYKITLSANKEEIIQVENFSVKNGFRPDYFYDVSAIDNKIVFSGNGYYTPDEKKQTCILYRPMESFQQRGIVANKLIQLDNGKVWLFSGKSLYDLERRGRNFEISTNSYSEIAGEFVGSYEFIHSFYNQLLVGSQEGFIFIDPSARNNQELIFPCSITKVLAGKDSVLENRNHHRLEYTLRSIKVEFVQPHFSEYDPVRYQYALISSGQDTVWSDWSEYSKAEFPDLTEGEYRFLVRSKINKSGVPGMVTEQQITVLPPWYRTTIAYACYGIMMLGILFLIFRIFKNHLAQEKLEMEKEKLRALEAQQEIFIAENLAREKELIELRNKQLEAEMLVKNTELASVATSLTQKNELLSSLKEKLEGFSNPSTDQEVNVKELIKAIDVELDFNDDWAQFQKHFDEVHGNFLHKLRARYPKLKPTWLLLCAYVRLNKTNKEISSLLNISVSAVEKRKYRLREKLDLNPEENLSDFLFNV